MNINYIFIKRTIIASLMLLVCYFLFSLVPVIGEKPQNMELDFTPIVGSSFNTAIKKNISESSNTIEFTYKLIGFRAGDSRASVIVKRNNETFVVQQGDLLENKYKLNSVDSNVAIFSQNGKSYQLSTNLQLDN